MWINEHNFIEFIYHKLNKDFFIFKMVTLWVKQRELTHTRRQEYKRE
jgi:hypothetical protein